jgi:hypothetical protein
MGVPGAVAVAATAAFYALLVRTRAPCGVDGTFCAAREGVACARLRAHLHGHLHGQTVATDLLADAICDHLENPHPSKPLVLAVHGPPGVGKSYFHQLLAQAVYGAVEDEDMPLTDDASAPRRDAAKHARDDDDDANERRVSNTTHVRSDGAFSFAMESLWFALETVERAVPGTVSSHGRKPLRRRSDAGAGRWFRACPGPDCPAYKLVFGTDYMASEAAEQTAALRDAVLRHLAVYDSSVIVVEEYDKMGCAARGVLRQLLEKGARDAAEFKKTIFVLEANAGFATIKKTLDEEDASSTFADATLSPAATTKTQRFLRDLVFSRWADDACEDLADTKKAVGAVDVFAPFTPLKRDGVFSILKSHLETRVADKTDTTVSGDAALASLTYETDSVLNFLTDQIEFEGKYAVEGGKEAPAALSRFVTRALRKAALKENDMFVSRTNALGGKDVRLSVAPRGNELVAVVVAEKSGAPSEPIGAG